jgi:DNA-binding protein HU-beta
MKKEELVTFVSEKANITKKSASEAVNAVLEGIAYTLEKGGSISLVGFGNFKVANRAAREGRNPSTGEKIQIEASKSIKFTPGATLKARINK